jgi:hypothetical protein
MKSIKKGELYRNLGGFLQTRGIELKEGAYSKRIEQACGILADAINAGQTGFEKARTEAGRTLEEVRQFIHEKTAPPTPPAPTPPSPAPNPLRAKKSAPRRSAAASTVRRKGQGRGS